MTHEEQCQAVLTDMHGKIQRKDWHGVADCAMDLRELEAYNRGCWEYNEFQEACNEIGLN